MQEQTLSAIDYTPSIRTSMRTAPRRSSPRLLDIGLIEPRTYCSALLGTVLTERRWTELEEIGPSTSGKTTRDISNILDGPGNEIQ